MSDRSDGPDQVAPSARAVVAALPAADRLVLPALQAVQAALGYVPDEAVAEVADVLNVSRADVHGVLTYYRDLRREPPAPVQVGVCAAEACQAVAGRDLTRDLAAHGLVAGRRSADGRADVREVFCLGLCAVGPAACVDDLPLGRATARSVAAAVTAAATDGAPTTFQSTASGRVAEAIVYVPADTAARAVGADEVAHALAVEAARRGRDIRVVRTGSRGLLWLEPLVEVATAAGRVGYGPVSVAEVADLLDAGLLEGDPHPRGVGVVAEHPYLAAQQRLTFQRVGVIAPLDLADYERHGGLAGLRAAIAGGADAMLTAVGESGLRGRGGAGFPAAVKWQTVAAAQAARKYVVCNADEGDSGTFADRMLMEGDPFCLLEGMAVAGLATGAAEGVVYVRSEYPAAIATLRAAVETATAAGVLGDSVLGSGPAFTVSVREGAGSYVCGEETAMLESLEGRRGMVRAKPPVPAVSGLFGSPTLVHNVLTLAAVPWIAVHGGAAYAALGTGRSRGTQVFQLGGNTARGGIVETAFGVTLSDLVHGYGQGTRSGRPVRAVQVGGPLGAYLPAGAMDVPLDYEAVAQAGGLLGHGGVVVFDDTVDMAAQARFAMEFCAVESCGKCTPCRIGSVRGVETIDRIVAGEDVDANLALLDDLCEVMTDGSLCAMGGLTPLPVRSALRHFGEDFVR
jgi:formate dehydrogenase iron-sulfur subunit